MVGMGSIIGIGLRIVSHREEIAKVWDELVPVIQTVRRNYPKITDLLDEIVPEVTKPEPEKFSVEWLQESLNTLGADPELEVDGDYGELTKDAVTEYQQEHSLEVDGWAGVETQASIYQELAKHK
jgi:hypothetical protein